MEATGRRATTIGRLGRSTIVLLALVAFVAACSNQAGGTTTNPPATQAAPSMAASPGTGPSQPASGGITLELANDAKLGDYVAGENGMALYVFTPDEGKDTSQCNDTCADNWPPLLGNVTAAAGVTGELGTITRQDGTTQVTLGGAPLYYFKNDSAAGDVKGQGLNDVWFLAGADGKAVKGAGGPAPQESNCGRYCY